VAQQYEINGPTFRISGDGQIFGSGTKSGSFDELYRSWADAQRAAYDTAVRLLNRWHPQNEIAAHYLEAAEILRPAFGEVSAVTYTNYDRSTTRVIG